MVTKKEVMEWIEEYMNKKADCEKEVHTIQVTDKQDKKVFGVLFKSGFAIHSHKPLSSQLVSPFCY